MVWKNLQLCFVQDHRSIMYWNIKAMKKNSSVLWGSHCYKDSSSDSLSVLVFVRSSNSSPSYGRKCKKSESECVETWWNSEDKPADTKAFSIILPSWHTNSLSWVWVMDTTSESCKSRTVSSYGPHRNLFRLQTSSSNSKRLHWPNEIKWSKAPAWVWMLFSVEKTILSFLLHWRNHITGKKRESSFWQRRGICGRRGWGLTWKLGEWHCVSRGVCRLMCMDCEDLCLLWVAPYPSGPLENLSIDDPQFFQLQAVLQVLWPTGIIDKDGQ